jgi:hypothetical protein
MSNNIQDVALTGLSTELIETVAQHLDKADLLSLRTTCRKLRNDSAYQFCQRYLSNVSTSGTTSSVLESIDVLRSPSLPHAQHFARSLTVRVILIAEGWVIDLDHLRKHLMPGQRDIARLLAAMPNLQHIVLEQHMLQKYVPVLESPLIFFKPITAPDNRAFHLRSLYLHGLRLDGDELAGVLERQTPDLRSVTFLLLTLTRSIKSTPWAQIITILCSMQLERFQFYRLHVLNQDGSSEELTFPMHVYTYAETGIWHKSRAVRHLASHAADLNLTPVGPALENCVVLGKRMHSWVSLAFRSSRPPGCHLTGFGLEFSC